VKIIYLANSIIPSREANSIHAMKMCEAFAKNGHEPVLIARHCNGIQTSNIYDFYGVDNNFELFTIHCIKVKGIAVLLLPRLYSKLKKYNPENVLIYSRDIYGVSLAVRLKYKVLYETHGLACNKIVYYLERSLLKKNRIIKLIVISEALRKLYISMFNTLNNIEVCHDAADIPSPHKQIDYSWPSKRDTLQIGYVGHLYKGRGIDIIIQSAMRLPQYDFHIVGGTDKDIVYWKQYKIRNLYFHGFVEPGKTYYIRNKCDVLLMPYQKEISIASRNVNTSSWMSPLKLFEYMSSGKTIIASDLPVLREVLNVDNSLLVQPDNLDEWVNAIRKSDDSEHREPLAKKAYESFINHYTWEKRAKKTLRGIKL